jgi:hypothetical protein
MNGVVTNMHPAEGVWLFRWASVSQCRLSLSCICAS